MKLRAAFRLARVALHLLGAVLTVAWVYPFCAAPVRLSLKQRWSRQLVAILGVELRVSGEVPKLGMIVSNHVSFLDIYLINAIVPSSFVAKDDVRKWPIIGWLAANTDTIYMERGSHRAAQRTRESLAGALRTGKLVALFPEGTTSAGESVLPFHGALLQSVIDAGAELTPAAIHYTDRAGRRSAAANYIGDTNLVECMWSIAVAPTLIAWVDILTPLASQAGDRRHLSAAAHRVIAHRISDTAAALAAPDTPP